MVCQSDPGHILKAGLSEEKLSLMTCLRTLSNVFLNALYSKEKELRNVLKQGIRSYFLEIHTVSETPQKKDSERCMFIV